MSPEDSFGDLNWEPMNSSTVGTQTESTLSQSQPLLVDSTSTHDSSDNVPDGYHFIKLLSSEHQCMSDVVLAKCSSTGKKVVLKRARKLEEHRFIEQELHLLRTVCYHESTPPPNIVHLHSPYLLDEVWLATEFVEGGSLERLCEEPHQLSLDEILNIALQSCEALAHLHSLNIIHRDVKPANILYNQETGTVQLADFGLSKQFDNAKQLHGEVTNFAGTKDYAAPEVFHDRVCAGSDMWAWACTMAHLITAVRPYRGDNFTVPYSDELRDHEFRRMNDVDDDVMENVPMIPELLMHASPNKRPPAEEVVVVLKRLIATREENEVEENVVATDSELLFSEVESAVAKGDTEKLLLFWESFRVPQSTVNQWIHVAINDHKDHVVEHLIRTFGGDINAKDDTPRRDTVLHTTIRRYETLPFSGVSALLPKLRWLVDLGALPHEPNHEGITPMSCALSYIHALRLKDTHNNRYYTNSYAEETVEMIGFFLNQGTEGPTQKTRKELVCSAIENNFPMEVIWLLAAETEDITLALEKACSCGASDAARMLLLQKKVDLTSNLGTLLLSIAIQNKQIEVANLLFEHGAKTDSTMLLNHACNSGLIQIVRHIVDQVAEPHLLDSALSAAIEAREDGVATLLVEKGVKVDDTTFIRLCEAGLTSCVRHVLSEQKQPSFIKSSPAPLEAAMEKHHNAIVTILIEMGAMISESAFQALRDRFYCTATLKTGGTCLLNPVVRSLLIARHENVDQQLFMEACKLGLADKARRFLEDDTENGCQLDLNRALSVTSSIEVATMLMKHGAKVNEEVFDDACSRGHTNLLLYYVDVVPFRPEEQPSLLASALKNGLRKVALQLIKKIPHIISSKAFSAACSNGLVDIVELALSLGVCVNGHPGNSETTPLVSALKHGHAVTARVLLQKGATPTSDALWWAACNQLASVVALLLAKGVDPNERVENPGWRSKIPLHAVLVTPCTSVNRLHIVKLLVDGGATVMPSTLEIAAGQENCKELLEFLLKHATPETINQTRALSFTCEFEVGELLIKRGVRCRETQWHKSALFRAAKRKDEPLALLLVRRQLVSTSLFSHALHHACQWGAVNLVDELLQQGVDVNAPFSSRNKSKKKSNKHQPKPFLHVAIRCGHLEIATLLLKHGAEPHAEHPVTGTPISLTVASCTRGRATPLFCQLLAKLLLSQNIVLFNKVHL